MATSIRINSQAEPIAPDSQRRPIRCSVRRLRRQALCAAVLAPVFVAIYYLAFWLRFEGQFNELQWNWLCSTMLWVVAVKLLLFAWFRVDQGWRRPVAFYDLMALVQAATGSLLAAVLVNRLLVPHQIIPRSVVLIDWGATIVLLGGARAVVRVVRERNWLLFLSPSRTPVFVVGANEAGESVLRAIRLNRPLNYQVVGFIDDDPRRYGTRVHGVPVIGGLQQTCQLAERHGVAEVLIAAGELSGRQVRKLVDQTRQRGINVKVLPSYEQLITGRVRIRPQPVSIDDLLRREPVELEMGNIQQWIHRRVVLVTGSAGSIGSEICRQLLSFSPGCIVLVDRSESGQFFLERELRAMAPGQRLEVCLADVLDEDRMRAVFEQFRPDIVFHAAAYKHVPLMELHPGEAVKNIVLATRQIADLAVQFGVESFVLISTDKAVNPTSVMGACKRVAELYVQSLSEATDGRFVTVRFGNVLDSAGSVVQVFRQQIARGGPVTVTDPNIERYFMTIPEAARLVIQAGAIGRSGEILVLDMGEPVRIVDLATDMIRLSGLRMGEDIEIEFTGLRPGEKLFEELHAPGETRLPTRHPHITIADGKRRDLDSLVYSISLLLEMANAGPHEVIRALWKILPEYRAMRETAPAQRRAAA